MKMWGPTRSVNPQKSNIQSILEYDLQIKDTFLPFLLTSQRRKRRSIALSGPRSRFFSYLKLLLHLIYQMIQKAVLFEWSLGQKLTLADLV